MSLFAVLQPEWPGGFEAGARLGHCVADPLGHR